MESNYPKRRRNNHLHPVGGGVSAKTPDTNSLAGINTQNSTPDAKSSSGFIQQINRLSEQEAIDQGYTVIKTAQDLDNIRNDLDGKYILMNDIDLSSYSNWDPIGEIDYDAGTGQIFTGTLDGNGYTISNLTINRPDEDGVGLFGTIGDPSTMTGGDIKNLGLENFKISGQAYVGALASFSFGTITNCHVTGDFASVEYTGGLVGDNSGTISNSFFIGKVASDGYVGGLAGVNNGTISSSFVIGNVIGFERVGGLVGENWGGMISGSFATVDVTGKYFVGGLSGHNADGTIVNSYAKGSIAGNSDIGGLVGWNQGTISNSYTSTLVKGVTNVGGLVGNNSEMWSNLENLIWDTESTGQNLACGFDDGMGISTNNNGLTSSQMQDSSNWQGWDTSIWDFSSYPPTLKNIPKDQQLIQPGGGTGSTDPGDPSKPDNPNTPGGGTGGAGDVPIPGAVRLQIGSDSSSTSAIYVDTSFDLGAFDVDFSSADSCAAAIEDIDEVLSRINTKRSEFGAVINRLSSILESQTTTIQNFTSAQSTIMDADIANESADFVKNQILQQTSSALLAQSQNLHASIVLSLIG